MLLIAHEPEALTKELSLLNLMYTIRYILSYPALMYLLLPGKLALVKLIMIISSKKTYTVKLQFSRFVNKINTW